MKWLGIGKLEFINGTMNGSLYIDILGRSLKSSPKKHTLGNNFLFHQNNDPNHVAKKNSFFNVLQVDSSYKWIRPAQSPDLNPIEQLWTLLNK